MIFDVKMG
jgi:hypothetical protein